MVAGQAEVAALAGERDAGVGLGAVADQVAEAPDLVDALASSTSASTASKAGRLPCTSESKRDAHSGAFYSVRRMGASAFATAAGDPGGGRGRRGGHVLAPPARRPDRTGRGRRKGYFTAFQLDRAEDFRSVQRLLGLGGLVAEHRDARLLGLAPAARRVVRAARAARPLLGAAAAAAGISLLLVVVGLPLSAVSHERAVDVGLATQRLAALARGHRASRPAIDAVFAAAGGVLALALVRRFRRNWWAPAAVVIVAFGVVTIWLFRS